MNNTLKDAYEQYRSKGFILQKSARYKKHAFREGAYADRENEKLVDSATGYVGIIPPNLIIVDNDKYEEHNEFDKLLKDLDLDYTPEPFALTPSGGEHYAFENPNTDMVIGTHGYKAVDIYAGYQSVIPIVGTTVKNKQDVLASYEWADDITEEFIVNKFDDSMLEVLKMRERAEASNNPYDDDMGLSVAIKAENMPDEEIKSLLEALPENLDYDTWIAVGMCIYDRYEANEDGLKLFKEFSKRSSEKYEEELTLKKWNSGALKPTQTTYKRLRSITNELSLKDIETDITTASEKDLRKIIKNVASMPRLNTRGKLDDKVRDDLAVKINTRMKDLKKLDPTVKVVQARTLTKEMQHEVSEEEIEEKGIDAKAYLKGTKYVVRIGKKKVEDLSATSAVTTLTNLGIPNAMAKTIVNKATVISGTEMTTDYMLGQDISYNIENAEGVEKLPLLVARKDPFYDVKSYIENEEIINDFMQKIWNGKAQDIVELIALSIRYGEQKLNRLMTVAPSNTGKTEIYTMLGFQKITMPRLLNGLRGDKGIGTQVVNGVKDSGLLLIDEANKALEAEIKDLDKDLYVDEFGAGGGTQKIKLHFTALTSTHKTATRNNSDELYNRFLQVELLESETAYHVTHSPIFQQDSVLYTEVISSYLRYHFKKCLTEDMYDKQYFSELQGKYRLPLNNDLDEFLYGVSEQVISNLKHLASDEGDILIRQGEYYAKRKGDITAMIEDLLKEVSSIDHGKYGEKIASHFIGAQSKTIKINGKPVKYYPLNLKTYTQDKEQQVVDEFEDLDLEEF